MVEERTVELQKAYSDLRDSHVRLIQSEKLAATGRLAASVAHEINNPLQGISNYLSIVSRQVDEEAPLYEDLEMVKLGFDRIAEIIRRLRAFYRPVGEGMEPTDVNGVVQRALALVGHQLSLGNVEVKTELAEQELPILGSAGQLEQVLVSAPGSDALNPAFDVTPAELVTAIITERVIYKPGELAALV